MAVKDKKELPPFEYQQATNYLLGLMRWGADLWSVM